VEETNCQEKEGYKTAYHNDEKKDLSALEVLRKEIIVAKEAAKNALKDAKKKLDNFAKAVKKDGKSYYHAIQVHWMAKGKSKAAYHSGAWNGKDARDAMKEPEHYYATMSSILGRHKANATTNKQIRDLLHRVCKLLHCWHEVFHALRSEKREIGWEVSLSLQISKAIKLHRKLGLRISPKVHTMEDHAL
jgi:hypothetical protein